MFAVISRSKTEEAIGVQDRASVLQRSRGAADLIFTLRDGSSFASRAFQQGALKVCFPNVPVSSRPEVVLLNTAGGLTGGDGLDIGVTMEADAAATVTSQACEKIYRSPGDMAEITVRLTLKTGAQLDWLPQPTIFFDGARLRRETHVEIADGASLLALEGIIFGRTAMGEIVETGALSDGWFIRCNGKLIHADRFNAHDPIGEVLTRPQVLNGQCAMATLRYVASDASRRLDDMRALLAAATCMAAASMVNGMMIVRFIANDGYSLTNNLVRVLAGFRSTTLPRVWLM